MSLFLYGELSSQTSIASIVRQTKRSFHETLFEITRFRSTPVLSAFSTSAVSLFSMDLRGLARSNFWEQ